MTGGASPVIDWDDAYANAAHIRGSEAYAARLAAAAAGFRAEWAGAHLRAGIAYGPHPRQQLDLFLPVGTPHGLVVFVHGGYWMSFDRNSWSHLAAGPLARGWAVAIPGYVLAPETRIARITAMIAEAIFVAAAAVPGPVRLVGHSAGGHLVARQVCGATRLPYALLARIDRVLAISGLFDLRPMLHLTLNQTLRLDLAEARAESPALLEPLPGTDLCAWVGADERPEFLRQSALIANVWSGLDARITHRIEPDRHHFNVIEGLTSATSPLISTLCDA